MTNKSKEQLIIEWKNMRGSFYNLLGEDIRKFDKAYSTHPLYESVKKHFDKSFKEVNQIAQKEIELFLK